MRSVVLSDQQNLLKGMRPSPIGRVGERRKPAAQLRELDRETIQLPEPGQLMRTRESPTKACGPATPSTPSTAARTRSRPVRQVPPGDLTAEQRAPMDRFGRGCAMRASCIQNAGCRKRVRGFVSEHN
jgi:hypothetical protein